MRAGGDRVSVHRGAKHTRRRGEDLNFPMKDRTSLEGAVSIITGARGGIGRGIARELAVAGSDVVLQVERDRERPVDVKDAARAQPLLEEIAALGRSALAVNCDVSDPAQVSAMVERAVEAFGRLDVLVNNAGIVRRCPVESMSDDEWDEVIDVNLKGMFLCCRAAIPHLKASSGAIVNNGSIASFGGAGGLAHYCASKHGVIGLTRALALELAPHRRHRQRRLPGHRGHADVVRGPHARPRPIPFVDRPRDPAGARPDTRGHGTRRGLPRDELQHHRPVDHGGWRHHLPRDVNDASRTPLARGRE